MSARDRLIIQDDPEWNDRVDGILAEHTEEVLAQVMDAVLSAMQGRTMEDPYTLGLDKALSILEGGDFG